MPLHGKIVVIKRNGGDGTEFPLTASCLFGRMPDCDIRIQLPQVSKEHCRIDLNENKEVVLTNLSSVNPTRVNGEVLQQSERLKHGDVITVIDRSFRFEYPPAPTPKKRSSVGGKAETLKVRQDQQVDATATVEAGEKTSEASADPHLKDGANHDNIQRSVQNTMDLVSKDDTSMLENKATSPFSDLYQMIKKSLDIKTPWKASASQPQTPSSKLCTPRPGSVRESVGKPKRAEVKSTPKKNEAKDCTGVETPQSVRKQRKSLQGPVTPTMLETTSPQRKQTKSTPQKFTVHDVIEQISDQTPMRRRSKEITPAKAASTGEQQAASGKAEKVSRKRKSGELGADLPASLLKKKRVSFGGYLSPELFDKRLPPDSPLRKGADPRRSLSLLKPKQSLLRRASVIGLVKPEQTKKGTPSPKKSSTKSASPKTPKSKSSSPKSASPAKKSPKSKSPSLAKKTLKSKSPSPAKTTPRSKPSPKAATPAKETPKSRSSSPRVASPAEKSPKSKSPSPARGRSPAKKVLTPKSKEQPKTPSHVAQKETPRDASIATTPAKTPSGSGAQTPTVQGRFSVSRISTPSPTTDTDAVTDQVPLVMVTPKIPLKRKSLKSTSRKTPSAAKSAVKVMHRSAISRASMKVLNSWADIVKFGKTKTQVAVPAKKMAAKKTAKKAVSKPQTPTRKLKCLMSTGHADSPMTITVGRAHKTMVVQPTGAAPRVVTNTAVSKKNMKMDEDLTGVSEMFKTPVNERKRRSVIENSATKTPAGAMNVSVAEPSVLNTPEETGEMIVSPLSAASAVKGRTFSSEAVQRLLNADQECSFVSDGDTTLKIQFESNEQQDTDVKAATVTTPKQKPHQPECLTGVKRMMKTPRQKVEPVEDLRGKILKTPKQKPKQQECLTGVKRIMKTPRQKTEPVEDLRGRILKTPKQKTEPKECLTGVKRIMKTPRDKAEPLDDIRGKILATPKQKLEQQECLTGMKKIFETPKQESTEDLKDEHLETPTAPEAGDMTSDDIQEILVTPARKQGSEMTEKSSPTLCLSGIKRITKTPKEKSAPVEDMVGVKRLMKTPRQKGEPVEENFGLKRLLKSPRLRGNAPVEDFEGLQELMEEPVPDSTEYQETNKDQTPVESVEDVLVEKSIDDRVDEKISEEEMANEKLPETALPAADPVQEKKPVRGRKAKTVQCKAAQDKEEAAPPPSEEPVAPAPTRGRRGKKSEAAAPPAVRQTTRGRAAKATESKDAELLKEESIPEPSKVALKPRRGRNAKKACDVEVEKPQKVLAENETTTLDSESDQSPATGVDQKASAEEVVSQSEQQVYTEDLPQADMPKDGHEISDQPEELSVEDKPVETMETVPQVPEIESALDVETEVTEMKPAAVQRKTARGRKGKVAASKEAEDKPEAADPPEEPVAPAPLRGRRGKKTEVTAPPAARQTTRTRNAKVETQAVTEVSTETMIEQTSDSKPSTEEAVVKPVRGRKSKQTPVEEAPTELEKEDAVNEPQPPMVTNTRRGRKAKNDAIEQSDVVAEDASVPMEPSEQRQPPVKAKRGRNAKKDDEKMDNGDTAQSQEPVKKVRRTRKAEQDHVEPEEDVKPVEMPEAPLIEAVTVSEQNTVPAKAKRGGRKMKQDPESMSTEVPAVNVTDKPRRGRKAKFTEDVTENPEHEQKAEEVGPAEPAPVAVKPSKTRGVKTAGSEMVQAVPAKRANRGTAAPLEEASAESTVQVLDSEPVKPAKRGRRATAAKEEASEQEMPSDTNRSRSVKWNMDVEVFEVPKKTPVKAVRGTRKTKLGDKVDTESKDASKDSDKTEEEDLSGTDVEAQPVKRVRRGAAEATSRAETQPRPRRGRPSKK